MQQPSLNMVPLLHLKEAKTSSEILMLNTMFVVNLSTAALSAIPNIKVTEPQGAFLLPRRHRTARPQVRQPMRQAAYPLPAWLQSQVLPLVMTTASA